MARGGLPGAGRLDGSILLSVAPGEVFGFLGPNGAGKTTTIRLMLDFIRPTRGRVRVLGAVPRGAPVWSFSPVQRLPHVHSGRLRARGVPRSRWTVSGLRGRDGRNGTAGASKFSRVGVTAFLPGD
jgi:ABC-type multidrug transport system fused ATPase/permease subunit